ncbi:KRAB-A domain-containing protein 2 [Frankliniella fusca]|uniref:KRAB-A domain-containing protein 2 n=1 Tax=Frankliniella fusca TaxID=407009 RepID=A0AAE1HHT6_9NEOP|nr:KRAB-A domain-containing protein 2 [Frankliniella fusca]
MKRFAVCTINDEERLIDPPQPGQTAMKFYVRTDELYIIAEAHLATEHKGRNVIQTMTGVKYANVTKVAIQTFIDLCPTCPTKKRVERKGLTVKPMIFSQLNDRMQIDLVDMQTMADGEWKWILVCQDHLTKFIHLRPLKSKHAAAVAEHVLSIFLVFGAPTVLQSDNGREFCNAIIESLKETWPELTIVHG